MNIWDTNASLGKTRSDMYKIINEYETSRELYYLAGLIMAAKYECSRDNLSQLFMLVEGKSLQRLCKVLGGQSIVVPTYQELIDSLKLIKFTHLYSKGLSLSEAVIESGFSESEVGRVSDEYAELVKELTSNNKK